MGWRRSAPDGRIRRSCPIASQSAVTAAESHRPHGSHRRRTAGKGLVLSATVRSPRPIGLSTYGKRPPRSDSTNGAEHRGRQHGREPAKYGLDPSAANAAACAAPVKATVMGAAMGWTDDEFVGRERRSGLARSRDSSCVVTVVTRGGLRPLRRKRKLLVTKRSLQGSRRRRRHPDGAPLLDTHRQVYEHRRQGAPHRSSRRAPRAQRGCGRHAPRVAHQAQEHLAAAGEAVRRDAGVHAVHGGARCSSTSS